MNIVTIPQLLFTAINQTDYKRKENLFLIIDLIYKKYSSVKYDEFERFNAYAEIPLFYFKSFIPKNSYLQEDIEFLINNNYIKRCNFYKYGPDPKSKKYKINPEFLSDTTDYQIQNKKMNERLDNEKRKKRRIKVENQKFQQSHYFKSLKIDYPKAKQAIMDRSKVEIKNIFDEMNINLNDDEIIKILNKKSTLSINGVDEAILTKIHNILHKHTLFNNQINSIRCGWLYFKRNKINDRLDTNLTCLPAFLRQYIICEEKLFSLDITNSQPFFLYAHLKNIGLDKHNDVKDFGLLCVSGKIYEFIQTKWLEFGIFRTREQAKVILFKIFYSKVGSHQKIKDYFGSFFPTIMEYIDTVNAVQNNVLAIQMQKMESSDVLDKIVPRINEKGIQCLTIHDSFICKESEVEIITECFNRTILELTGLVPQLKVEPLINDNYYTELITSYQDFDSIEEIFEEHIPTNYNEVA